MRDMSFSEMLLRGVFDPASTLATIWRKVPLGSIELRCKFDAVEKPQYAFGVITAAKLARSLKIGKISVIEFGVGAGAGLLQMEKIAADVSRRLGIEIEVYGFDRAEGLPMPRDYRDVPYHWTHHSEVHDFRMSPQHLRAKLKSAQLVLGDVEETVATFYEKYRPAPIAFVAFDLDLYSSTAAALKIFETEQSSTLPRVITYFDDTVSAGDEMYNEFTGGLLGIREFNDRHPSMKLCKINGLYSTRYRKSSWSDAVYVMHSFAHPLYDHDAR
jgi:hypothetical protein